MNKVIIIGHLTKDAELKFTSGKGTPVATLTVAVNTGYGDNKETAFVPVVVWGKAAESVANHTQKGSKVLVQGRISTRSYDGKDGTKKYVTEVIADNYNGIEFLDNKNSSGQSDDYNSYGANVTPVEDSGDIPF